MNTENKITTTDPTLEQAVPKEVQNTVFGKPVGDGNDYSFIQKKRDDFIASKTPFTLPVSILIPVYNRKDVLAKSLAGLTHQTYPKDLIEVIIADDGSSDGVEQVIEEYRTYFTIRHVFQEDRGYRLSAVRNLGLAKASHEHIVLLDSDMIPTPDLVTSYMEYLHVSDDALLIGHRRFVCVDSVSKGEVLNNIESAISLPDIHPQNLVFRALNYPPHDWRLRTYKVTDNLRKSLYPFIVCSGCNLAYSKRIYERAGPYCEEFQYWGGEDQEWAYRVYASGAYFIPVHSALALHQEPPNGNNETDRVEGRAQTVPLVEELCPLKLRPFVSGKTYRVPKISICIVSQKAWEGVSKTFSSLLAQDYTDFECVIIADPKGTSEANIFYQRYSKDKRIRWEHPDSDNDSQSFAAIEKSKGAYIVMLEPGDVLRPNAITTIADYFDNNNIGLAYWRCDPTNPSSNHWAANAASPHLYSSKTYLGAFRKRDWTRAKAQGKLTNSTNEAAPYHHLKKICSVQDLSEVVCTRM